MAGVWGLDLHLMKEPLTAEQQAMVAAHVGLVHYMFKRLGNAPHSLEDREDVLQAGMIGLIESVRRFDPEQGAAFSTFACIRIRGAMLDHVRSQNGGRNGKLYNVSFVEFEDGERDIYIPSEEDGYGEAEDKLDAAQRVALLTEVAERVLTPGQLKIYRMMASGMVRTEIIRSLGCSPSYVYQMSAEITARLRRACKGEQWFSA